MLSYKHAKSAHIKLGKQGEKIARKFLVSKNIDVLLCNYRNKRGEIDLLKMCPTSESAARFLDLVQSD